MNLPALEDRAKVSIVITGGAGFIGSHLVDRFLADGFRVVCIDNLLTGKRKNLAIHEKNPRFHFIEHDVTKRIEIPQSLTPVLAMLHFASPASPIDYLKLPIQTLKVGSLGTHNVLGTALKHGARFLLASTSEVYGDPLVHPQPETYWGNVNPIGPRGVYDEAKRFAEAITMAYHRIHHVNTKIVRIFNTYGPRMRLADGRAIPAFVSQAMAGKKITVFGDGTQTRSFCYVTDLVEGIVRLLWSNTNDPVNLGNPREMTILELAKIVQSWIGSGSEIGFEPLPVDDPKVRKPDIGRAQNLLSWEPKVAFEDGLRHTLDFFRKAVAEEK